MIDPPNDDDPTIVAESIWTLFWRVSVSDKRIIEIIELEPSISKISISFKNTRDGCWIAFTGKRIANKIEARLNAQGIVTHLQSCNIHGGIDDLEPIDHGTGAGSFYYCIGEYGNQVKVWFVPVCYWNDHETVCDIDLDEMLSQFKPTEVSYCYQALGRDMLQAKAFLDRKGFRENLLFQAFINDRTGE